MPIYAYKCESCGHAKDVLQKISDPPLTVCPACAAATFSKQLTAAGFQLKGSGWYATDFRHSGSAAAGAAADAASAPDTAGAAGGSSGESAAASATAASAASATSAQAAPCGASCACH
jgi:putative FmdB family regulatory protein